MHQDIQAIEDEKNDGDNDDDKSSDEGWAFDLAFLNGLSNLPYHSIHRVSGYVQKECRSRESKKEV